MENKTWVTIYEACDPIIVHAIIFKFEEAGITYNVLDKTGAYGGGMQQTVQVVRKTLVGRPRSQRK